MAIKLADQYPGKTAGTNTEYPLGQARNVTAPGDGTGTPWEAALVNDDQGFKQAILKAANVTPSGNPDTAVESQYLAALGILFESKGFVSAELTESAGKWEVPLKIGGLTLIFQGGAGISTTGTQVTFKKTFPTKCLTLQITDREGYAAHGYSELSRTGFVIRSTGLLSYDFFAIGY